jgi:hypothetical protein
MSGWATITDEVVLDDGRHVILQVREAYCLVDEITLPRGRYVSLSQHFDHSRGAD